MTWREIFARRYTEALRSHDNNNQLSLEAYSELGKKMSPNFTEARPLIFQLWWGAATRNPC